METLPKNIIKQLPIKTQRALHYAAPKKFDAPASLSLKKLSPWLLQKPRRLNTVNPTAYRNTQWKYYIPVLKNQPVFSNTSQGPYFKINPRTGARKPVNIERMARFVGMSTKNFRHYTFQRGKKNTEAEYKKRVSLALKKEPRINISKQQRRAREIYRDIQAYAGGNNRALNNRSLQNIMFSLKSNMYVKNGKVWRRYKGGPPLTKNNVLENIRLTF